MEYWQLAQSYVLWIFSLQPLKTKVQTSNGKSEEKHSQYFIKTNRVYTL